MWQGFDPEMRRQLDSIQEMVRLRHLAPTREWPLAFDAQHDALLVVREWPNGSVTAYMASEPSAHPDSKD